MKKITLLDCTLRDGGYYNNWDFSNELVSEYLKVMSLVGIDYVEMGFRSFKSKGFKGPSFYTTDNYIENFSIPKSLKIAVMVNVSELTAHPLGPLKAIRLLFKKSKDSKIKLIRLASHYEEFSTASKICKILKTMGYEVGINLMQISEQSKEKIISIAKIANNAKPDILYFADSLGSMVPSEVSNLISNLRYNWKGPIGIHAHDNLKQAIDNTLEAVNKGVEWVDSTVTGMGRGPGNVQTEHFLIEIENIKKRKINILPLLKLIKKYFEPLKNKYEWGTNTYYYMSGKYGIHPTYIQQMLAKNYSATELLSTIEQLRISGAARYNADLVKSEFQKSIKIKNGTWAPLSKIKKKQVLMIASGVKMKDYKNEIEKYIKLKKPFVIALNTNVIINKKLIDAYVACNPLNLIRDVNLYKNLSSPLIVPKSILSEKLKKKFKKTKILDFGVGVKENVFKFYKKGATIPRLYTLGYALAVATSGKTSKILLAGFDGYGPNSTQTKEINKLFYTYSTFKESKELISITPTYYSVNSSSIYVL